MSEHASPPAASINIACVNTVPRSWSGARSPDQGTAVDNAGPSPIRSAKRPNACSPAWATTCVPPHSTSAFNVLLRFTSRVPSWSAFLICRNLKKSRPGGPFRGYATSTHPRLVKDQG
jgi:hypothetical protein